MLGERIKKVREIKKLTAKELSIGLNITEKTLSSYENNKIKPSYYLFEYLNKIFNVNINWLLTGQGEIFIGEENLESKVDEINQIDYDMGISLDNKKLHREKIKNIINSLTTITNDKLLDYIDAKVVEIIKEYELRNFIYNRNQKDVMNM